MCGWVYVSVSDTVKVREMLCVCEPDCELVWVPDGDVDCEGDEVCEVVWVLRELDAVIDMTWCTTSQRACCALGEEDLLCVGVHVECVVVEDKVVL